MPHLSEQLKTGRDGDKSGMMLETCRTAEDREEEFNKLSR